MSTLGVNLGLLDKIVPKSVKALFSKSDQRVVSQFKTITEYSPSFSTWDGSLYEQALTRAIVERIAVACSKLKPEFVTPDGSAGSIPRVQRLITSWPNDMMTWPNFLRRVSTLLMVDTVAYVVPQYDERDAQAVVGLWPMKPSYTEVVEYEGEPWFRFHTPTGEVQAFPFYDVAIITRFQYESDIFGSGNIPLTPTLRLMDAQRQAEEIALKTGADIRFIGKLSGMVHEKDMERKRDRFSETNLSTSNKSGLLLYDQTFENIEQIKSEHYTVDPDEMERINKTLYAYFGVNEDILNSSYDERTWNSFYESVVEPFAIELGEKLSQILLTGTQVRKGNRIMFSSSYLEYASTDSKIKVAQLLTTSGLGTRNEVRDIFQLPRVRGGDVYMVRGEYYMIDEDNNIIAESGGHGDHETTWYDDLTDLDEPDQPDEPDDVTSALRAQAANVIKRRLEGVGK